MKDMTVWDINHKRGGKVSSNDFEVSGGTALHWAAYYGKVEIAKLLFEKGASALRQCVYSVPKYRY